MSIRILENVRLFAGGADLTGQANKLEISAEAEEKETTNFGSVDTAGRLWKEVIGGIASAKISGGGQWEAGDTGRVDDDAWAAIGGAGAWTAFPHSLTAAVGDVAWLTSVLRSNYQFGGAVGDVNSWSTSGTSTLPLVRGFGLHPPGTARTATGNGTGVQAGAVASDKYVYAALHVLSVSGTTPSMVVKVQSDDNSGFTTPTDRITFAAAAGRTSEISRLAGAITDDYWRVVWTITGTTPSFLFLASLGIR